MNLLGNTSKYICCILGGIILSSCNSGASSTNSTGTLTVGSVGGYINAGMCTFTISGNPSLSFSPTVTGSAGGSTFTCSAFDCTNRVKMNGTTGGTLNISAANYSPITVTISPNDCGTLF